MFACRSYSPFLCIFYMRVKTLLYSLLSLLLFSSCAQLKNITARDSSASKPHQKKNTGEIAFLEDISLTPGQASTSRHSTADPGRGSKKSGGSSNSSNYPPINLEGSDGLQLKYALLLNTSPENLYNTDLLKLVDQWWGTPYVLGGNSRDGIDCSAFSQLVLGIIYQVQIPRTADEQYKKSEKISDDQLQEGDLVFFSSGRSINHVGVFITNNKFVHASTSQGVMISDLGENYWKNKYKGAGRIKN